MAGSRWTPLDVGYFHNPKARAAGKNGRALHIASCCWSADNLTDGKILPTDLSLLCAEAEVPKSTADVLVREGLWHIAEDGIGWEIHDFLIHNKSKESIEEVRRKWATKKAGQRDMSHGDTPGDSRESLDTRHRQTDRHRHELVVDDDDSLATGQPSSSSVVDSIVDLTAWALARADRENPNKRYIAGIARNVRAERLAEVNACISAGMSTHDAAVKLAGSKAYVELAELEMPK